MNLISQSRTPLKVLPHLSRIKSESYLDPKQPCYSAELNLQSKITSEEEEIRYKKTLSRADETTTHTKNQLYYKQKIISSSVIFEESCQEYYRASESEVLSNKKVDFESHCRYFKPALKPTQERRPTSILKKSNRSSSVSSLKLNSSMDKLPGKVNTISQPTLHKFRSLMAEFKAKEHGQIRNKSYLYKGDKFTDQIFPPLYSSLFSVQKTAANRKKIGNQIVWKRISQVLSGQKLRLIKDPGQQSSIAIKSGKYSARYFAESLNSIKQCDQLLQNMFKQCQINSYGIYCVNIFHQSGWKYILIDDFIPVVKDQQTQGYLPAFINVIPLKSNQYRKVGLQIWPFLLEKAYASYYSTYETLQYGNMTDFVQEISGRCFLSLNRQQLQKRIPLNSKHIVTSTGKQNDLVLNWSQANKSKEDPLNFKLIQFRRDMYKVSKVLPKDKGIENLPFISVKKITVTAPSYLSIMVRQKDERFYHHSAVLYRYIWNRVVLLYKEYDGNFAWIDGEYSNSKSINFSFNAKSGQYFLIVMPEWKPIHRHEINIIVGCDSDCFDIESEQFDRKEQMLEKGCSDLAQRNGKLEQINKITCSYNYIDPKSAIAMESIHNQRIGGSIAVMREWRCKSNQLVPYNWQFAGAEQRKNVEIQIDKDGQYTLVVLKVGGNNIEVFKDFKF